MANPACLDGYDATPLSGDFAAWNFAPHELFAAPVATRSDPLPEPEPFRILIAADSAEVESLFDPVVTAFAARVVQVRNASSLSKALREPTGFGLVLSDTRLSGMTGLGMLASAHQNGHRLPFMVVQWSREDSIRVVIGGGTRAVLATRVVSTAGLIELAEALLGIAATPPVSRRSHPPSASRITR